MSSFPNFDPDKNSQAHLEIQIPSQGGHWAVVVVGVAVVVVVGAVVLVDVVLVNGMFIVGEISEIA